MTAPYGQTLDVVTIQQLIPHRSPFLLVDRVVSWTANERLTALKSVTMNEPFFPGHFPAQPVMPGVLILEALAQAAALLAILSMPPETRTQSAVFLMGIDGARFRRPVVPGDRLELQVEVVKRKGPVWVQGGKALVDGQLVAEAQFMAKIADH
jgi:3-hydroxyacyl-[acyl-carrier-protein] dehydratase